MERTVWIEEKEDMRGEYKEFGVTQKRTEIFTCGKSQLNSTEDPTVCIPVMSAIYFKL